MSKVPTTSPIRGETGETRDKGTYGRRLDYPQANWAPAQVTEAPRRQAGSTENRSTTIDPSSPCFPDADATCRRWWAVGRGRIVIRFQIWWWGITDLIREQLVGNRANQNRGVIFLVQVQLFFFFFFFGVLPVGQVGHSTE
jgi:hypothetical protein